VVDVSVLVTGGHGQLGVALARRGGARVVALGRDQLDLLDERSIVAALDRVRPRVVVNAAAWTAVDLAESHEAAAWAVNAEGAGRLARLCAARGVGIVQLSTDYVFDGAAGRPYQPHDPTRPLSAYGRSKLAGEAAVREANEQHVVLRTSWVVGADRPNFVATMVRLARGEGAMRVVSDQRGGLTPADGLADAVLAVVAAWNEAPWGTWHVGGQPWTTWHEVAVEVARLCGRSAPVEAITTAQWPTPARRPLDGRLDCSAFEERFSVSIRWREALPALVQAWRVHAEESR
jgi:dTDP-4-dehydrorhamnose reductase